MVSNARDDFPEPERPVKTTILFRGISTVIFFRLWVRAPLTTSLSAPGLKSAFAPLWACESVPFFVITKSYLYTHLCPRMGPGVRYERTIAERQSIKKPAS